MKEDAIVSINYDLMLSISDSIKTCYTRNVGNRRAYAIEELSPAFALGSNALGRLSTPRSPSVSSLT